MSHDGGGGHEIENLFLLQQILILTRLLLQQIAQNLISSFVVGRESNGTSGLVLHVSLGVVHAVLHVYLVSVRVYGRQKPRVAISFYGCLGKLFHEEDLFHEHDGRYECVLPRVPSRGKARLYVEPSRF